MSRNTKDTIWIICFVLTALALLLNVVVGCCPEDRATARRERREHMRYLKEGGWR